MRGCTVKKEKIFVTYSEILANSSYIRKPFLIYDFASDPIRISLQGKFCFLFYQWEKVGGEKDWKIGWEEGKGKGGKGKGGKGITGEGVEWVSKEKQWIMLK